MTFITQVVQEDKIVGLITDHFETPNPLEMGSFSELKRRVSVIFLRAQSTGQKS